LHLLDRLGWRDRYEVLEGFTAQDCDAAILHRAEDIRAIVTGAAKGVPDTLWERLPRLELVAVHGVGRDKIDAERAASRGVKLCFSSDFLTADVADLAIGLWLSVTRRIVEYDHYVRAGSWETEGPPGLARRATGSRVGILGLGKIGAAIARRAAPFTSEISYHSRRARSDVPWQYAPTVEALMQSSDVVFISTSGSASGLVGHAELTALGSGILINVARGQVLDQVALIDALQSGRLAGAGLDVFSDEPRVPAALRALDCVVLQPHMGSATSETRADMARDVLRALDANLSSGN
jgi:lactate dehydrogenase-like 2-hydroxyacid dehydrogenase